MTVLNFRYHVVSLVAVFLALAIGVVLGAGPLQRPIGDTLTGQLSEARNSRDSYKAQVGQLEAKIAGYGKAASALKADVVTGALTGLRVAVVALPGADGADVSAATAILGEAGAEVVAQVNVNPSFTDPATNTYRTTFAGQLRAYLEPKVGAEATTEQIFALALAQVLTSSTENAVTVAAFLEATETPFVSLPQAATGAAHSIVVVGPRSQEDLAAALGNPDAESLKLHSNYLVALASGLGQAGLGGMVLGDASTDASLVTRLRNSGDAVSTLDAVGTDFSTVFTPRVLAASLSSKHGAYGVEASATEGLPLAGALPALPELGASVLSSSTGVQPGASAPAPAPSAQPTGQDAQPSPSTSN
ncbi:copper transporter [Buchananella felis]|uniref:copper transporter n=1 Tax=Buchananella felis TaxID=3231492 RepID=UPI003529682D